ncbi:MAG: zf-TFIIB domain-containing protein [Candidatus Binatia bacterium]
MTCPKCTGALQAVRVGTTEVDRCPQCGGVWCDDHELQTLLDGPRQALAALRGGAGDELDQRPAICPRDGARLTRMFSSRTRTVTVDACPDCQGIWLDGGELDRLVGAARSRP